jgi:glycosyltransferase involved in cell wall biosynthesis
MSSPKCSLVIRTFNEEKHIGRLLSGVLQQTLQDFEIILVDSGSTDATLAIASRYPVRVVSIRPEDFTYGRSLNVGCQAAQGQFLVFASAHVYPVYPDWLERLLAPFADQQVALTYGKQRGDRRTRFSETQMFAKMFPSQSNFKQNHPFCNNANAAIRRELWLEQSYDESLSGLEDLAWASWAIDQGYLLAYVAEAEVIHVHEESPHQIYNRYRREAIALAQIRPQEHFNFTDLIRLFVGNAVNDLRAAWSQNRILKEIWQILQFRWMQFWGTYQGFRYVGPVTREMIQTFYYPNHQAALYNDVDRKVERLDYASRVDGQPGDPPTEQRAITSGDKDDSSDD